MLALVLLFEVCALLDFARDFEFERVLLDELPGFEVAVCSLLVPLPGALPAILPGALELVLAPWLRASDGALRSDFAPALGPGLEFAGSAGRVVAVGRGIARSVIWISALADAEVGDAGLGHDSSILYKNLGSAGSWCHCCCCVCSYCFSPDEV